MRARLSFPVFRLGLLMVVAAAGYAAMRFYVDFGQRFADMTGESPPMTSKEAESQYVWHYLLGSAGSIAFLAGGAVLMVLGVARWFVPRKKQVAAAANSEGLSRRAGRP